MQRRGHAGIFGTPPEPIFNMESIGPGKELLEDWLQSLSNKSVEFMKKSTGNEGHFKQENVAEFVFQTCDKLRLGVEARFLAVELFEAFMIQHITDLHGHVQANSSSNSKKKDWKTIMDRVRGQLCLRVITCCQLASKLTSHYRIITARKAHHTLIDLGHRYTRDNIIQSELRVLKTLKYNLTVPTPLIYIESFLEILGHNEPTLDVKAYHDICVQILDLYYMERPDVYIKLYNIVIGNQSESEREKFCSVERDFMLLGVSVIAASTYVVDTTHTDHVIICLSQISRIPCDDIIDFATVFVQAIMPGRARES